MYPGIHIYFSETFIVIPFLILICFPFYNIIKLSNDLLLAYYLLYYLFIYVLYAGEMVSTWVHGVKEP